MGVAAVGALLLGFQVQLGLSIVINICLAATACG